MSDTVMQAEQLGKSFGRNLVLDGLDLDVERGTVYGLLGRNGAGKTTAIRILLGLLYPTRGSSRVLDLDSQRCDLPPDLQVGYVAEGQKLYPWMSVAESAWFSSNFYPDWDRAHAESLLARFELDPGKKVRELSRGMVGKLCLALALAHRPKIMVLDEPTAGLDAIVRREFLESLVEFVEQEGMTVLIASHMLNDLERIVDHIGFLDRGRIKISGSLERIRTSFRKVKLSGVTPENDRLQVPGILREEHSGREVLLVLRDFDAETEKALRESGAQSIEFVPMSLEDLFAECLTPASLEDKSC